jgi:hypothetical protein
MSRHVLGKIDNYHHRTTRNAYIGNIDHSSRLIIRHRANFGPSVEASIDAGNGVYPELSSLSN